ncbi:MAG: hypothetical protein WAJ87_09520 [Bryobacteraceae bacterium]
MPGPYRDLEEFVIANREEFVSELNQACVTGESAMSETREHIHELIERLPPAQLSAVAGLLEAMLDNSVAAPVEDEPITDEDRRSVREGRAWFAQRGGKGIPMEEVLSDFGLKPEDFPLTK